MTMERNIDLTINEICSEYGFDAGAIDFIRGGEELAVEKKNGKITVEYQKTADVARALLIIKANDDAENYRITERRDFDGVGLLLDCSRNAVRNVNTVKELIRNIAALGYDSLMLYTEDTYELDNEPAFGYLRGRYTKAELKELDAYAAKFGIELIPAIQTLAHLNQLTRYKYSLFKCFDCSDILLVGEKRTYELIDEMFRTLSECFTSRRAHIGMDEAGLLGRGKYISVNGYREQFDIILEHLYKVCEIAKKYGIEPIIWSDMFWRICDDNDKHRNEKGEVVIPEEIIAKIPDNLILCHWEYRWTNESDHYAKLKMHEQYNNPVWFAGGTAWDNRGFLPHLSYSLKTATAAIGAAKKFGVKNLLETAWGDNGGECSVFAILPALAHYAYTARGIGEERLKKEFYALTGYNFDDYMKLEDGQTFCGDFTSDVCNPAKYGLYNDLFSGYLDTVIREEDERYFAKARDEIGKFREKGKYAYIFETAYRLNDLLSVKYSLGVKLRKAYAAGDKRRLAELAEDIREAIDKAEKFIAAYRAQWYRENKPAGLEIHEIRLGGLKERMSGCLERLEAYLRGEIDEIYGLGEKLLPEAVGRDAKNGRCDEFSHMAIASVNSFDGFTEVDV